MSPAKEITEVYFYTFLVLKFTLSSLRGLLGSCGWGAFKFQGKKSHIYKRSGIRTSKIWIGKAKVNVLFLGDDILNSLLWWYTNSLYYAAIQQMSSKLARGYTQPISKFLPCVLPAATPWQNLVKLPRKQQAPLYCLYLVCTELRPFRLWISARNPLVMSRFYM